MKGFLICPGFSYEHLFEKDLIFILGKNPKRQNYKNYTDMSRPPYSSYPPSPSKALLPFFPLVEEIPAAVINPSRHRLTSSATMYLFRHHYIKSPSLY